MYTHNNEYGTFIIRSLVTIFQKETLRFDYGESGTTSMGSFPDRYVHHFIRVS